MMIAGGNAVAMAAAFNALVAHDHRQRYHQQPLHSRRRHLQHCDSRISNSIIAGNAVESGGGIYTEGGECTIGKSSITGKYR